MSVPMVLLGAGASKDAGVPTSFEMTRAIVLARNDGWTPWTGALNFVCGALIAHDTSQEGTNPYDGLDVERVVAALGLLARREEHELTPFVSAWLPGVEEWDVIKYVPVGFEERFYRAFDAGQRDLRRGSGSEDSMGEVLGDLIEAVTTKGAQGGIFGELLGQVVTELVRLLRTDPEAVAYLTPLAALARDAPGGVTVATLNYDVAVEQAATAAGVPVHTGIRQWVEDGRWRWPDTGLRLLKLHGSIDWARVVVKEAGRLEQTIVVPAEDPSHVKVPSLVFGHGAKLTAEGPFLSLLGEFERQLSVAPALVVVGYSFRDDHVNELLRRWINDDHARVLTVIDPRFPEGDEGPPFTRALREALGVVEWAPDADPAARLRVLRAAAADGLRTVLA